jgi:hypothetical protein
MRDFKDEIQNEIDRIISEQKELAKQETDKLLSNSRKEIKEQFETNNETIENIVIKQSKRSNFIKKMFFIILGFVFILFLVFAYYKLDYFESYRIKEKPILIEEIKEDTLNPLNTELQELIANRNCFSSLLAAELSGKKINTSCGVSSGKKGAGNRTNMLIETIDNLTLQIDSLKIKIGNE